MIKLNQFNSLRSNESTETPREWNIQPPAAHLKSRTSPPKTSTEVSPIIGILNHHNIDNGDVEVHPSEFPVESNSECVPYQYNTPIKSIDDD